MFTSRPKAWLLNVTSRRGFRYHAKVTHPGADHAVVAYPQCLFLITECYVTYERLLNIYVLLSTEYVKPSIFDLISPRSSWIAGRCLRTHLCVVKFVDWLVGFLFIYVVLFSSILILGRNFLYKMMIKSIHILPHT